MFRTDNEPRAPWQFDPRRVIHRIQLIDPFPLRVSDVDNINHWYDLPITSIDGLAVHLDFLVQRTSNVCIELVTRLRGIGLDPSEVCKRVGVKGLPIAVLPTTVTGFDHPDGHLVFGCKDDEEFRRDVFEAYRNQGLSTARIFLAHSL